MKLYNSRILKVLTALTLSFSAVAAIGLVANNSKSAVEANAYYTPSTHYTVTGGTGYYTSISDSASGDTLLSALQSLNSTKRKKTMGYSAMGTSASSTPYVYTDYDPSTTTTDSNGQTYGTKLLSFYSGASVTSYNKEHVWPNSRGGSYVEADIFMPRPTISSENSNRGNSFYVEGVASSSSGWDPVTAFGESGCYGGTSIRGESARIIFYSMVASSSLSLSDSTNIASGGTGYTTTMGKLSDMIKWSLNNPVNTREVNRNNGGEYLQGNRNPFVDHPEYVCKIWGSTNSTTQSLCAGSSATLTGLTMNSSSASLVYAGTTQLSVTPTPSNASSSVTWSSSNSSIASVSSTGLVTAGSTAGSAVITATSTSNTSISCTCTINVSAPSNVTLTGVSAAALEVSVSGTGTIVPVNAPTNAYPYPTYSYVSADTGIATVSSSGIVTGIAAGSTTVTITATQGSTVKTGICAVTVSTNPTSGTWTLASSIASGDKVIFVYNTTPVVAGALSSTYLTSLDTGITISNDLATISALPSTAEVFTVGGTSGAYTFTDAGSGLLGCSAAKNVNLSGTGTTTWAVTFSGSVPTITSGTSSYGSLQYNSSSPRFTTYTSSMKSIQIYKKTGTAPTDSVSLDKSSLSLTVNGTSTLVATASGSVTWSSSASSIASVSSSGLVTGVAAGNATITATCGTATATCAVTVSSPSSAQTATIVASDLATAYETTETSHTNAASTLTFTTYYCSTFSSKIQWKKSVGYLYSTTALNNIQSITLNGVSGTLTVYGSTTSGQKTTEITGSSGVYDLSSYSYSYFYIANASTSVATCTSIDVVYGGGSSTYTADQFAQNFLDYVTCDSTGASAPTLSKTWSELATLYGTISSTTEQNLLVNATYTVSGTGASTVVTATGSTTTVVAQAMYRYDYIIAKYGTASYTAFITGRTSGLSAASGVLENNSNNENIIPLIVIIAIVGVSAVGGYFFIRRRKDNH